MADPASSHLDVRFSHPDAEATPWDETLLALKQAELFWVTTVRSDGRPHTTPVVAVWSDEAVHFSTGVGEQKEVNLRNNRQVILATGPPPPRWWETLEPPPLTDEELDHYARVIDAEAFWGDLDQLFQQAANRNYDRVMAVAGDCLS